jgi:TonB-dependent SusC/RagA subfamily outer membrane receptor
MKAFKFRAALPLLIGMGLLSLDAPLLSDGFFGMLKNQLQQYNKQMPEEKVYLQLDKPFYKPGDAIWFQSYLLDANHHKASSISNVIYVELINPKGNVEQKLTLAADNGTARGDFALDAAAPGGLYKIRAYTQWMQNFGEETFFTKEFQVQKIIHPKLLLKLDFERDAYGPSEKVVATLKARDLDNLPIASQEISFSVQLAGKQLMQRKATTTADGQVMVSFSLPDTLSSSDGLLNIIVPHKGVSESISRAIPIVLHNIDLQFFPEGGDLVSGMQSRVAFKALNEWGKAADVEGVVVDDTGKEVQGFKSFHKGMGAFKFTPESGRKYSAKITKPVALAKQYALPSAMPNGWGLNIEKKNENALLLTVYSPLLKPLYLVAQVRGEIYYTREILPAKGYNTLEVPLDSFPIGVAQFTLFDHQQLERCERLVFVNQHRKLHVDITADKAYYLPREKVELNIRTYDEHQLPLPAKLSLSVVDDKLISFADDKQDNILSHLLLSSDVRGKIEEPSFYFDPQEPKAIEALDYLLMTQAWRRFSWQEVQERNNKISLNPEKMGSVSGRVINAATNKPIEATVTLVEVTNRRRAAQLKTKPDGSFLFLKVDPAAAVQLFAKGSGVKEENLKLVLDNNVSPYYDFLAETGGMPPVQEMFEMVADSEVMIIEVPDEEEIESDLSFSDMEAVPITSQAVVLQEDVEQLSEVVVTGYGIQERKSLGYAVTSIRKEEIASLPGQTIEQALQGRVAGVQIARNSSTPGAAASISIRGSSSLASGDPLYVVDGFPIQSSGRNSQAALGFLSPDDIRSISVLKSAEATAIYGSRATNGVILINTKSGRYYGVDYDIRYPNNYASLYIEPRKFSAVREFYSPEYAEKAPVAKREDFRETIYWNPLVQTDRRGEAKVSFYNSDATTAFRVTAEGIGANGYVGRQEWVYSTTLPLSVEARIPAYLSFEDKVSIPIQLTNNTNEAVKGKLEVVAPSALKAISSWNPAVEVAPKSTATYYYDALVQNEAGDFTLQVNFENSAFKDQVVQSIEVLPKGFPVAVSFSGQDLEKAFSFLIKDPVPGSVSAGFTAYPNVVGDLLGGIASILQQPHGCFEQVSSSTYPNVLALQFMRETNSADPAIEEKALAYIRDGYKRLAAYETSAGGFEWYGDTPPHEGLTAFGLLELTEMKEVWEGVSTPLLNRTREFLLDRRTGDGNFKQDMGKYGFSGASREVTNAYIVYALSACGVDKPIQKEFELAYQEALKSGDAYRMALMANAAFNLKKEPEAGRLMQGLRKQLKEVGWGKLKADHSLVRSYGNSLQIETASLFAMAMMKEPQPKLMQLQEAINYLVGTRTHGYFGSTQGTILALTALTEYAKFSRKTQDDGLISLYLNGNALASTRYEKEQREEILLASLEKNMAAGNQNFRVIFDETKEALPYSFNASWTSYTPATSKDCRVDLSTKLSAAEVKLNETVRLTTTLTNKTASAIPQTVAIIGIPSGLSLQPWQLKEYQEKGLFDFYEVQGNFVIFYYREMAPKDKRIISLDLRAEIPGTYQASASSAYLYYTNEYKDWEEGAKIKVLK